MAGETLSGQISHPYQSSNLTEDSLPASRFHTHVPIQGFKTPSVIQILTVITHWRETNGTLKAHFKYLIQIS
jgi:hypothetical protein